MIADEGNDMSQDESAVPDSSEGAAATSKEAAEVSADPALKKRWYVLQAFSGYEKHVKLALREHARRAEMEEMFGDILVPTEEVVEMRGGQKRTSERKFFPGYVLVNMVMNDDTWHMVKGVPRVAGFIGGVDHRPIPISNKEADDIIRQMDDSVDQPKMKYTFAAGEMVRIIDGPFAEFNGVVEEANYEKSKLRVSVTIFGRSTPVELDFSQVEKG